jgi:hypothetical protein
MICENRERDKDVMVYFKVPSFQFYKLRKFRKEIFINAKERGINVTNLKNPERKYSLRRYGNESGINFQIPEEKNYLKLKQKNICHLSDTGHYTLTRLVWEC